MVSYVYGMSLISQKNGENSYYYVYNAHGDVVELLNSLGETKATYNYDAFGKLLSQTGEIENHITYAGYIYDSETGLYYLNARMYDPETMRFMQYDTYAGRTTDALSLNRYAYCQGNPLRYIDPTGHTAEEGTGEDNTSLIARIWSKVKSLMSQSIFSQMASDITNFVNSVKSVGFAKTCDLCMYELEDKAVEILTYTAATVLIAGGIAVTALSGGTLTVGGVALAGLGMGLISAGVSVGMMTYNQMETQNCITASVGDYLKTASLSFATGFVSGTVGAVTGGATGAITSKVFSSSVSVATQYATKYAVNFGLETLGDAFVQKVTTGEVNWKQAVISGALDTVIGASIDGVSAIVKNWDSVKYSAKSFFSNEDGYISVAKTSSEYSGLEWYNYFVGKYGKESIKSTFINEIKYTPTSGVKFLPTEGRTTTILGRYDMDTQYIFHETGNIKSISYDGHIGGFNLLNVPDVLSNAPGVDFWNDYNVPFLDEAIGRNDIILLATIPNNSSMYRINRQTGVLELSGFGKEIKYLESKGYVFDENSMQMVYKK